MTKNEFNNKQEKTKIDKNDVHSMSDKNNNDMNSKNKIEKKISGNTSFNQSLGSVMEVEETLKQA